MFDEPIIQFKVILISMLKYCLVVLMPILMVCQVSPSWLTCPYMQTSTMQLITNGLTMNQGLYSNLTYDFRGNRTQPYVLIAITDLNFINQATMGIYADINLDRMPLGFTIRYRVLNGTSVTKLNLRYLAFDNNIFGSTIRIQFSNQTTFTNHTGVYINNNSGTIRTSTQQMNFYAAIDVTHNWLCLPYMTGFQASSANIYEWQITCNKKTNNTYQFSITAHNDTNIKQVTMYFLFVDQTDLQDTMLYVVDWAITRSQKGIQKSFFTPSQPIFDNTYLHGLKSFSLVKNIGFTFAINNSLFTVPTYSNVDQTTHFCLRTRQCNSPHSYYSKPHLLCYQVCPGQTYLVSNYSLCKACHYSCLTCNNADSCQTCNTNFVNYTSNTVCQCLPYYYLSSDLTCQPCYYYCQTCSSPGTLFSCLSCESSMARQLVSGACTCKSGYKEMGVKKCLQICGDGNVYEDPCDDGNTVNGDGCSSTCKIQSNFSCEIPDGSSASKCYYTGSLSISIARIQKSVYSNSVSFYVLISPYIDLMASLSAQNTIHTNATLSGQSITSLSPYLIFTGTYSEALQNLNLSISLIPTSTGSFSRINISTVVFTATSSNGLALTVYPDWVYQNVSKFSKACQIFGYVFVVSFFIFCFTKHRQIGIETFFTIQFMWMCIMFLNNLSPMSAALGQARYVMGYNGAFGSQKLPFPSRSSLILMRYSTGFQYNFNIMVIIQVLGLIMYFIYRVYLRINGNIAYREDGNMVRKVLQIFRFDFFVYWTFINFNQILLSTIVQAPTTTNAGIYIYIAICILSLIVSIVAILLFKDSMISYRSALYSSRQKFTFPLVVIGMIVMNVLLLIAVYTLTFAFYFLLAIPILFMGYTILIRPFRLLANNIRFFMNYFFLFLVICLYIIMSTVNSSSIQIPIVILVCMVIVLLINVGVWIYTIVIQILGKYQHEMISEYNQKQMKELNTKMNEEQKSLRSKIKKIDIQQQTNRDISVYKKYSATKTNHQRKMIQKFKRETSLQQSKRTQQNPLSTVRQKRDLFL